MPVRIQHEDFDISAEIAALRDARRDVGAVASFVGIVRDIAWSDQVGLPKNKCDLSKTVLF